MALTPTAVGDPSVHANVDWRLRECAKAVREITKHRPGFKWMIWAKRGGIAILVLGLLLVGLGAIVGEQGNLLALLPWLVLIAIWVALLGGGFSWLTAWQLRRNNPHLTAGQVHEISPEGYRVRCGAVTSITEWAGIVRFVETADFFLTFPVRNAAYYLPKRCLDLTDIAALRSLTDRHLPPGAARLAV